MTISTEVFPSRSTIDAEYAFFRNVVFSTLHRRFADGEGPEILRQAITSKWSGVPARADLSWLALEGLKHDFPRPENLASVFLEDGGTPGIRILNDISAHSWIRAIVEAQNESIRQSIGKTACYTVGVEDPISAEENIHAAFRWLERHWPEACVCARKFISHVVLVKSDDFMSSSHQSALGLVFINPRSDWDLGHFVEAILHESAHIELRIRQFGEAFLLNPRHLADSPLRPDPRPLDGILHAAFVLARTTEGLRRMSSQVGSPPSAASLLRKYRADLAAAITTLGREALFTEKGSALFESLGRDGSFRDALLQPPGRNSDKQI